MLKIEKTVLPSPEQWEIVVKGMRNPMNSWEWSDSRFDYLTDGEIVDVEPVVRIGTNDHKLMTSLNKGGTEHSKYRRMLPVWVTVNAPLYWWKEADRYRHGVEMNSCSTMHKIHAKKFTMDDFSCEHLGKFESGVMGYLIDSLNWARERFLETKEKNFWWQMIQLIPSSYNQKRTLMVNYEVLAKMYRERKNHKLDEWHTFCAWIKSLPYSELITGEE